MPRLELHPDDKRNLRFTIPLSPSEAELIDKAAAVYLGSRAEFIRHFAKDAAFRILRQEAKKEAADEGKRATG